jgi:hypothetical protein
MESLQEGEGEGGVELINLHTLTLNNFQHNVYI